MADDRPPGWTFNPSSWSGRLPVLGLALAGCAIAGYLALYQVGQLSRVREPCFGEGSRRILRESSIAHLLPVPDAALGALIYLFEAIADGVGGRARWRTLPGVVLVLALIAVGLAVGGLLLTICQWVLFEAYCTLCLASAACSVLAVGFVLAELLAALQYLKPQHEQGKPLWPLLWGHEIRPLGGSLAREHRR